MPYKQTTIVNRVVFSRNGNFWNRRYKCLWNLAELQARVCLKNVVSSSMGTIDYNTLPLAWMMTTWDRIQTHEQWIMLSQENEPYKKIFILDQNTFQVPLGKQIPASGMVGMLNMRIFIIWYMIPQVMFVISSTFMLAL